MCGLCAMSRPPEHSSIQNGHRFIRAGLIAIESRGRHACGVGFVRGKGKHVWYTKHQGRAGREAWRLDLGKARLNTAIGHTRHATAGDPKCYDNNHPVTYGGIVLAHNGRVDNVEELLDLVGVDPVGEVDSFAFPALLAHQHQLDAHPAELLELVEGVASIVWLDADDPSSLHLARLTTRPLTFAHTKRGDFVASSTPSTLHRHARIAGLKIEQVTSMPEGTYIRVVGGKIVEWQDFTPKRPKVRYAEDMPGMPSPTGHLPRGERSPVSGITDWWEQAEFDWPELDANAPLPEPTDAEVFDANAPVVMGHDEYLQTRGGGWRELP